MRAMANTAVGGEFIATGRPDTPHLRSVLRVLGLGCGFGLWNARGRAEVLSPMKTSLLLVMLGALSVTTLPSRADTLALHPDIQPVLSAGLGTGLGASLTSSPAALLLPASGGLNLGGVRSFVTIAPAPTPEPASLAMMVTGLAGIGAAYRRRRSAAKA